MIIKTNAAKHKLYILATPIGNLKEISTRAIEAIHNSTCIFCEDTRITAKLLNYLKIKNKKLISYQKFNEKEKLDFALQMINNEQCLLVSDAGYPCISDPGFNLTEACYRNKIAVEVINGPSSLIHSLVMSGININNFYFNGFLNANKTQRTNRLKELLEIKVPIVFFESVHRIKQSLFDINKILMPAQFIICRELTKINETIYRGSFEEIINEITEKGEFVIIVVPNKQNNKSTESINFIYEVGKLIKRDGIKLKEACKRIANKYDLSASDLYSQLIQTKANKKI